MVEMQLQQAGYLAISSSSGESALDLLGHGRFDLLITDLQLPEIDGLRLIAEARRLDPDIAAIIMSGISNTSSILAALNQQVHNYLLKPVLPVELMRGVNEALTRRRRMAERNTGYSARRMEQTEQHILHIGPLRIDPYRHRVTCGERTIRLSQTEFLLLLYLSQHQGRVISHQEIVREVLRYNCSQLEARNLAKSRIHTLRRKIEHLSCSHRLIHNVRGTGYRLLDDDELEGFQPLG